MEEPLVFGWRTAVLTVPMLIMVLTAAALTQPLQNRRANGWLAALLIVLTGMCVPWAIGFAGFYDRYRWLTFAPFAISLAIAPLFYFYLHTLVSGALPQRYWRHLALPLAQFAYMLVSFTLPLEIKQDWSRLQAPYYSNILLVLFVLGALYYAWLGTRLLARYREWLAANRSDDDRFAARWINRALIVAGVMLGVWLLFEIRDQIDPLGYSGLMGLYIAIATFGTFLAFEGWRHAALRFPHFDPTTPEPSDTQPLNPDGQGEGLVEGRAEDQPAETKDWAAMGQNWAKRITDERLYRDPELTIQNLARILGTNQTYISRALNEGLGQNFSTFINGLRSEDVATRLSGENAQDILSIALDSGFNSKASFHRSFRARYGVTPSAYREAQMANPQSQIQ